ncbi:hypothetical protein [Bradyrhizobium elkanii]|uniref:hypothetical protein n=1 Tax=Bradyrhizobium elkanii TaxID=29448 RepID=UPI00114CACC7|nr:hypothetical protein [Bradyrhizobium elkanii]
MFGVELSIVRREPVEMPIAPAGAGRSYSLDLGRVDAAGAELYGAANLVDQGHPYGDDLGAGSEPQTGQRGGLLPLSQRGHESGWRDRPRQIRRNGVHERRAQPQYQTLGLKRAFGGYVNFVITKNLNAVGPTWTLTHSKARAAFLDCPEVNTDKLTFAFAERSAEPLPARRKLRERSLY